MTKTSRAVLAALTSVILLLGLAPAVGAASSATPLPSDATVAKKKSGKVRVTLKANKKYVPKGKVVTLKGRVKGVNGRPTVTIFQQNVGSKKWHVEARKKLSRKGRFVNRDDLNTGSRRYKACVAGKCSKKVLVIMGKRPKGKKDPKDPQDPKDPTQPKEPTSMSVTSINPASVEAGKATTVSGTASGNMVGQTVYVQAFDDGSTTWGSVGSARVNPDGTWAASSTFTTAGRGIQVRVIFGGSSRLVDSAAPAPAITVFGWYFLNDRGPLDEVAGSWESDSYAVNGVTYPKSVGFGFSQFTDSRSAEANLARSCIRFQAVAGLSDDSQTSGRYAANIKGDSVTLFSQTNLRLGQQVPVDFDLSNVLRLRLEVTRTAGGSADVVFGDARVLCAF